MKSCSWIQISSSVRTHFQWRKGFKVRGSCDWLSFSSEEARQEDLSLLPPSLQLSWLTPSASSDSRTSGWHSAAAARQTRRCGRSPTRRQFSTWVAYKNAWQSTHLSLFRSCLCRKAMTAHHRLLKRQWGRSSVNTELAAHHVTPRDSQQRTERGITLSRNNAHNLFSSDVIWLWLMKAFCLLFVRQLKLHSGIYSTINVDNVDNRIKKIRIISDLFWVFYMRIKCLVILSPWIFNLRQIYRVK